jgi:hypothetical protein
MDPLVSLISLPQCTDIKQMNFILLNLERLSNGAPILRYEDSARLQVAPLMPGRPPF